MAGKIKFLETFVEFRYDDVKFSLVNLTAFVKRNFLIINRIFPALSTISGKIQWKEKKL